MKLRAVLPPMKSIDEHKQLPNNVASLQIIETRFLELIAQQMGFSYELMLPVDGQFGLRQPNGSWTGIIGMIQRDEADLSVAHLAITKQRLQAIDFSDSYWAQDQSFMTELPPLLPKTYFFTYPFTLAVWLAVLSVMAIVTFFLVPGGSFGTVLMTVMRGLCRQPLTIRSDKTIASRLMLGHWLLFANFVTLSYCAVLLSFLTVPLRNKGVETIDDLCRAVKKGSYKALVPKGSSILPHITNSDYKNWQELGKAILKNHWEYDTREGIDNYFQYGTALIGHKMRFRGFNISRRFISKDSFGTWNVGVALNRRFCCKKRLNLLLGRMGGAGLYQKIFEEEFFKASLGQQNSQSDSLNKQEASSASLSIDDLYGVFALLVEGYIVAGVALLLELVWNYVCHIRARHHV
ncbi:hypothetical protein JTE90_025960 [Oedothorax gibbosus]|uniref:Ionotropic glutamate receptor L-glutamate and glycine-binding domain-containing protein n=1 Tax=Oedothorax gibbosus TaxID=931172 RepID=A0AAV6U1S7_9ARAC|nr:hypothetical protein JTE90_025960 [Oedothorax gibbosus]